RTRHDAARRFGDQGLHLNAHHGLSVLISHAAQNHSGATECKLDGVKLLTGEELQDRLRAAAARGAIRLRDEAGLGGPEQVPSRGYIANLEVPISIRGSSVVAPGASLGVARA